MNKIFYTSEKKHFFLLLLLFFSLVSSNNLYAQYSENYEHYLTNKLSKGFKYFKKIRINYVKGTTHNFVNDYIKVAFEVQEPLYLSVSSLGSNNIYGCYLYDFGFTNDKQVCHVQKRTEDIFGSNTPSLLPEYVYVSPDRDGYKNCESFCAKLTPGFLYFFTLEVKTREQPTTDNNSFGVLDLKMIVDERPYLQQELLKISQETSTDTGESENGKPSSSTHISSSENYILTRTYTNEEGTSYLDQIQYYDGLGRPNELVQKHASPKCNDLVILNEYDDIDRESNFWLPTVIKENDGAFVPIVNLKSEAIKFYNDSNPYYYFVYEQSPLNRILKKVAAGSDWQSLDKDPSKARGISTNFLTNTATTHANFDLSDYLVCRMYTVSDVNDKCRLCCSGDYASNELYVTEVIDENGNKTYQFKDKQDQVLLRRSVNDNQFYDTYYIYDTYGNLRVVLPPKASATLTSGNWTDEAQELKDYAYLYKYDTQNRCIAKRIPGIGWIKMVYDHGDHMVFSQTAVQMDKNEWEFTIPDVFGRVVLTGVCTLANDSLITNDRFSDNVIKAEYTTKGGYKGYTIFSDALPISLKDCKIHTVNYYDYYDFMGTNGFPSTGDTNFAYENLSGFGQRYQPSAKGLLTGTATARFNDATTLNYDYAVNYYDERSRLVQGKSTNHLGGIDKTYLAYNFIDKPVKMQHVHSASGKATQTELYTYEYDHVGRLLTTKHKLNTGTEMLLVNNSYDELGRLQSNSRTGSNPNLKTDYTYNVRSWMKTISNPLFNETLYYQDTPTNVPKYTRNYNGNISAMNWQSDDKKSRTYVFNYDNLSRLTESTYSQTDNTGANFSDSCRYDMHGNVTSIKRYGRTGTTSFGLIDNLTMNYKGNQLIKAEDTAPTPQFTNLTDFRNMVNQALEYEYDKNGNMTKDLNKGISNISYNSLNLPISLVIANSLGTATNNYTYSANGEKLKIGMKFGNQIKTTDYVDNMIYENDVLKRILVDGGYVENGQYHFYIQDHLGNNRVVAKSDGRVIQTNHYYPFGITFMEDGTHDTKAQPYKYNGKEFDSERGLNLYDYLARSMDPVIGRFMGVDPLAEKHYSISPYAYCAENPVNRTDPDGKDDYEVNSKGKVVNRIKNTERDAFFMVNNKGNRIKGKELSLKYGTIENFKTEYSKKAKTMFDWYNVRGDDNGKELFEFFANNTTVEWSQLLLGQIGDNGLNIISTSHLKNKEKSVVFLLDNQYQFGYTIRGHIHSHPGNTPYPSGLGKRDGDIGFSYMLKTKAGSGIPAFDIYLPGSNQYIRYSPSSTIHDFDPTKTIFHLPEVIIKKERIRHHVKFDN